MRTLPIERHEIVACYLSQRNGGLDHRYAVELVARAAGVSVGAVERRVRAWVGPDDEPRMPVNPDTRSVTYRYVALRADGLGHELAVARIAQETGLDLAGVRVLLLQAEIANPYPEEVMR